MDERAPDFAALAAAAPETAIAVLTDPRAFFGKMPREGGYEAPGTFAGVMLVAYGVILALLALVGFGMHGFFAALLLVPIFGAIGLLIGAAVLLFASRALGGEATFESSFRIVAYSSAVSPIAAAATLIPYLPLLANAYALYLVIVAVITVHRVPEDKAWRILGGIGAVFLVLSLLATIAGRHAERTLEELQPELEKWKQQMEKSAQDVERATEQMKRGLERQQRAE